PGRELGLGEAVDGALVARPQPEDALPQREGARVFAPTRRELGEAHERLRVATEPRGRGVEVLARASPPTLAQLVLDEGEGPRNLARLVARERLVGRHDLRL